VEEISKHPEGGKWKRKVREADLGSAKRQADTFITNEDGA
jgi:hypothetical protein